MKNKFLAPNISKLKRLGVLFLTIILLGWTWHYLTAYRPWDIRIPSISAGSSVPDYEFHNITVREVSGDSTFYKLSSRGLTLDKQKCIFDGISGNILTGKAPSLYFESSKGILDFNVQEADFRGFYAKTVPNGKLKDPWQITGPGALWNKKQQTMSIAKDPVVRNKNTVIKSSKLIYYLPLYYFVIGPDCDITNGDYHISCQKASLKEKVNVLTLEENVIFESKTIHGRSDTLDINYDTSDYVLKNNVIIQYNDSGLHGDFVSFNALTNDSITLKGNVKFSYKKDGQNISAQSDRAFIDRVKKIIYFYENTKASKNDSYLESNQLIFDYNKNEFDATGGGRTKIIKSNND